MARPSLGQNDVGVLIQHRLKRLDTDPDSNTFGQLLVVDLTDLSTVVFRFKSPTSTVVERTGAVQGTPTNGIVEYTTVSGDFDEPGLWMVQPIITYTSGSQFAGTPRSYDVHERFEVST